MKFSLRFNFASFEISFQNREIKVSQKSVAKIKWRYIKII